MSMSIQAFVGDIAINSMIHRGNPNRLAELNAIASALATDPTTHDKTIETAPVGLQSGLATNTKFQNDILAVVNIGKAGGLTPLAMGNAITAGLSSFLPPVNTSAPAVTGTATVGSTLTTTVGNWSYVPTSYTYQWMRGATAISGATASTYVIATPDKTFTLSCMVTANNAAGSTSISSGTRRRRSRERHARRRRAAAATAWRRGRAVPHFERFAQGAAGGLLLDPSLAGAGRPAQRGRLLRRFALPPLLQDAISAAKTTAILRSAGIAVPS